MAHWMSISERYKVSSIIFMNSPNLPKVSSQSPELVFSSIVNLFFENRNQVVDSPKIFNAMCFDEIFEEVKKNNSEISLGGGAFINSKIRELVLKKCIMYSVNSSA